MGLLLEEPSLFLDSRLVDWKGHSHFLDHSIAVKALMAEGQSRFLGHYRLRSHYSKIAIASALAT